MYYKYQLVNFFTPNLLTIFQILSIIIQKENKLMIDPTCWKLKIKLVVIEENIK